MEIEYTNFDGDWNEPCAFCGQPNQAHQVNAGSHDGVTYIHYQPCEEQLQQAKRCAVVNPGILPRLFQRIRARSLSSLRS